MNEMRLWKMGADPEFILANNREWNLSLVPANTIITANKALGLQTFIGVDGHASTAELRPPAARNIKLLLHHIAYGLGAMSEFLKRNKKYINTGIYATPIACGENMGGHIHTSFLVNDPELRAVEEANYVLLPGGWAVLDATRQTPPVTAATKAIFQRVADRAADSQCYSYLLHGQVMHYLLLPFEKWVQPYARRENRFAHYGEEAGDPVRHVPSRRPAAERFKNWAYFHFEYRTPSTWLQHPVLAYCYLALGKLTALNFTRIAERLPPAINDKARGIKRKASADDVFNDYYYQIFKDRLAALDEIPDLRLSRDLQDLRPALAMLRENREAWLNPANPVDLNAWMRLRMEV